MDRSAYMTGTAWVGESRRKWPPTIKVIAAFILGFLLLSPAILGLYWDLILPGG